MGRYTDSATAPVEDDTRPGQCTVDRFPDDTLLRKRGFTVVSRPRRGEPIWRRRGQLFGQSAAVAQALRENRL